MTAAEDNDVQKLDNLHPESEIVIRGLVDFFYKKKEYQFDVTLPEWKLFVNNLINCAQKDDLKKKIIYTRDGTQEYLHRYYLINERPKLRVTLHKTLISDSDSLHNHPWDWASLILTGGYYEDTPNGIHRREPGNFRIRTKDDFHKLVADPQDQPIWTLFFMGEKKQDWGFLQKDGTVKQWQKYLHEKTGIWYADS